MSNSSAYDPSRPEEGYRPAIPLPFYVWSFWKWQKVRCMCGATFVSRNLGLMPPEYEQLYALKHIAGVVGP